jgi:hypothetical protein
MELGEVSGTSEGQPAQTEQRAILPTDVLESKASGSASGVALDTRPNRATQEHAQLQETESVIRTREEVAIPFSVRTGFFALALFLVSFIVILVVRGVVDNVPMLFNFFANIYLAGKNISAAG